MTRRGNAGLLLGLIPFPGRNEFQFIPVLFGGTSLVRGIRQIGARLLPISQAGYVQGMQVILMLVFRSQNVKNQIEDTGLVQRPQDLVVQTGIVIESLLRVRWNIQNVSC